MHIKSLAVLFYLFFLNQEGTLLGPGQQVALEVWVEFWNCFNGELSPQSRTVALVDRLYDAELNAAIIPGWFRWVWIKVGTAVRLAGEFKDHHNTNPQHQAHTKSHQRTSETGESCFCFLKTSTKTCWGPEGPLATLELIMSAAASSFHEMKPADGDTKGDGRRLLTF